MSEEKQTVAGAYAKMNAHEDLCAERYDRINETLGDLKQGAKWIIGLLIGLMGWLAVQVWDGQKADIVAAGNRPQAVSAVAAVLSVSRTVAERSVDPV